MVNAAVIDDLKARLAAQAGAEGFAAIGFAPSGNDAQTGARLDIWLEAGFHGTMGWLADRADARRGPQAMWPGARSVIALAMSYAPAVDPLTLAGQPDRARISAYAQGRDYHDVMKKALKRLARWLVAQGEAAGLDPIQLKVFVDTAPVMEKPLA
ncbi:MAG: epoxyqueuosine reductase, partial [Novosphingobium sp.]